MGNSGIYIIKNTSNNKIYVGQSINTEARQQEHMRKLRNNNHSNDYLQKSFNKYGEEVFDFIVIDRCPKEDLDKLESHYIEKYNSMDKNCGYNLKGGGHLPRLSESSKMKISETRKKRIADGTIKKMHIEFTEESIAKMRESSRIRWESEEERIKLSNAKSTVSRKTVEQIKEMLYKDETVERVIEKTGASEVIIKHIMNLRSQKHIASHYNAYISNRHAIHLARQTRKILKSYRDGATYQSIADDNGIHIRTAIRIINDNKCEFDIDQRIKVEKRQRERFLRLVSAMKVKGWTITKMAKVLKVVRPTMQKALKEIEPAPR